MTIQWPFFLLAVALLMPPLPLSRELRRYVLKSRRNATTSVKSLAGQWQNWADFFRAAVGVYILTQWAFTVDPEIKGAAMRALVIQGVTLGVVLLVQTIRYTEGIRVIAPIFYLSGMTLILAGLEVGGFAVFVGWLFAIGGNKPVYQMPLMAIGLGGAGYVLGAISLPLILNCGLILVPLVIAFLSRQSMAYVAREPIAFG